ncbi:MAG: Alkaline phosphatase synthesis sensor protein PhoR [Syntrophaceae bacterium PtaU1.Bin231]|nr:MAG: Alkaline phosphatase synthesis sensor protein PhoR [Syntrophaceae bacterium PtaB.Bin038]OPY86244.1 MAG: Alkaline phosphatase synthesis sensor protein PhoR [Syntrophaceae bacterium PtaU1.Bin231]
MGENRSSRKSIRFFSFCLAMAAAVVLVQPALPPADGLATGAETRDRKPFIIASQRNAPPFSFADRDGAPQGILIEFWRLWAARNGHEITFQLGDLDETIEAVRRGKADFHSGLFYSEPRSGYLDFSSGFIDDTLSLFVLDKLDIHSLSDLAATPVVVGVSRDHFAAEYMQYNYPLLRLKLYPNSEDVVMRALRNELVAFAVDYPVAFYFLSKHDARGQFRVVTDLATHQLRAAFRKGNRETLDVVESGLQKIGREDIARLSDKWGLREKRLFPPWLVKALIGGGAGLLFLALLVNGYLLRREVRRKTRELNDKNRILNLINRDILEATQTAQSQMETMEKLARDKDDLLRIVTEDLRGPIQGIHQLTEKGKEGWNPDIHDRTARLLTLIDRLLEASRLEAETYRQDMEPMNLTDFLDRRRKEFRELAAMKSIRVEMSLPNHPVPVLLHPVHFAEICRQLVLNAVKFSQPGSDVQVNLVQEEGDDGKKALVQFRDRGIGIPRDLLPRIFERASGAAREGTLGEPSLGIGLSVVRRLLELHGGSIRVESEEGRGSTFTVELPVTEEAAVSYDDVEYRLQTGDIVLFKGLYLDRDQQPHPSENWTHAGLVVKIPERQEPLLWESTPLESITDRILGVRKGGPQLVSLRERLLTYETDVYAWRPLRVARSPEMIRAMFEYIYKVHRLPFPAQIEVIRRVIQTRFFLRWWPRTPIYRSIFCTELIAETYMRMGLLPETPPASAYLPLDFSERRKIPLLKGASLGREMLLHVTGRKERFILPAGLAGKGKQ